MPAQPLSERLYDDADRGAIDPFALFEEWFALAQDSETNDPNAMALATVDAAGMPDVRMVLLNLRDARGFAWFTNVESAKGQELGAAPRAALCFHWKSIRRQVRLRGPVEAVTPAEADAYFATRPRTSQLGAHASRQSRPLASKAELAAAVEREDKRFGEGTVPRPANWSGYRLRPIAIEFWKDGAFRLHDRMQFTRDTPDGDWSRRRLYP